MPHNLQEIRTTRIHQTRSYTQSPGPGPTFPKRSVKCVCDHDHKNPGSKEPAEKSDSLNLKTCANLIANPRPAIT